jgi:hypothetical protein
MDSVDTLNLYPYYEKLLREKRKTRTIRLGDQTSKYRRGQLFTLTCGWTPEQSSKLGKIRVLDVCSTQIKSLRDADLEGESPDCLRVAAIPYVLSAIYRKVVLENDIVTVIRWSYLD